MADRKGKYDTWFTPLSSQNKQNFYWIKTFQGTGPVPLFIRDDRVRL